MLADRRKSAGFNNQMELKTYRRSVTIMDPRNSEGTTNFIPYRRKGQKQDSTAMTSFNPDPMLTFNINFWHPFTVNEHFLLTMLRMTQHRLMKLSRPNRLLFTRCSLSFGALSACCLGFSTFTNNWLYTSEVLKYYEPVNSTVNYESLNEYEKPTFFKNSTLGPWLYCFQKPQSPVTCKSVDYFSAELPGDTTDSVEGMSTFLCLIVYMARVSREVGKKMFPESPIDEPMFYYEYGYSFVAVMASFMSTELSAVLILSVYMAKHDEQIFNKYHIRSLFKSQVLGRFTVGMMQGAQAAKEASDEAKLPKPAALVAADPALNVTPRGSSISTGRIGRYHRRNTSVCSSVDSGVVNQRISVNKRNPSTVGTLDEMELELQDKNNYEGSITERSRFINKSLTDFDHSFVSGLNRESGTFSSLSDQDSQVF